MNPLRRHRRSTQEKATHHPRHVSANKIAEEKRMAPLSRPVDTRIMTGVV